MPDRLDVHAVARHVVSLHAAAVAASDHVDTVDGLDSPGRIEAEANAADAAVLLRGARQAYAALTGCDASAAVRHATDYVALHHQDEAVALLTGSLPEHEPATGGDGQPADTCSGELLVHVWPAGTADAAIRTRVGGRWGIPAQLRSRR